MREPVVLESIVEIPLEQHFNLGIADEGPIAAYFEHGQVLVLDQMLQVLHSFRIPNKLDDVAIAPESKSLAISCRDRLLLTKLDGEVLHTFTHQPWSQWGSGYSLFSRDGASLWTSWLVNGEPTVHLIDLHERTVRASVALPDADPESGFHLDYHPEGELVTISLSNPYGCGHFWVYRSDSRLKVLIQPRIWETYTCSFHSSGSEFVTTNEIGTLLRFSFPAGAVTGELSAGQAFDTSPFDRPLDRFSFFHCYVGDQLALACTGEMRLFLVNTREMRVDREVLLAGHPLHPSYMNKSTLGGDVMEMWLIPHQRLLVHHLSGDKDFQNSLGLYDAKEICTPLPSPSEDALITREAIRLSEV